MIRAVCILATLMLLALTARAAEKDKLRLTERSAIRHRMGELMKPGRLAAIGHAIRGTRPAAAVTHTAVRSARVARDVVATASVKAKSSARTWGKSREPSRDAQHEGGESSRTQASGRKGAASARRSSK